MLILYLIPTQAVLGVGYNQILMLQTIPVTFGNNIDPISIILLFSFLIKTSKESYFGPSIVTYAHSFYIDVCSLYWYTYFYLYAAVTVYVAYIWVYMS